MSQYTVEAYQNASHEDVMDCCRIMWAEHPFPKKHWPHFTGYCQAVLDDGAEDLRSVVCRINGDLVGAMSIGELTTDSHFPGTGIIVYNIVVDSAHPRTTRLLYRYLIDLIREGGGSWYQTTRRVSETEFQSKFRRIHG